MPRFAIVMPNYNCGEFVGKAIESALNQSFTDYAVTVSDNASSDSSREQISRFNNSRLQIHLHDQCLEKTANWNRAFALAPDCEYLVNLHSDDILSPDCLRTIDAAIKQQRPALVYGAIQLMEYDGSPSPRKSFFPLGHKTSGDLQKEILILANPVHVVGTCIRRDLFEKLGGWPAKYNFMQDLDLWLQLADEGISHYLPVKFGYYRKHGPLVSQAGQIMDELAFWRDYLPMVQQPAMKEAVTANLFWWLDRANWLESQGDPAQNRLQILIAEISTLLKAQQRPALDLLKRARWLRFKSALMPSES